MVYKKCQPSINSTFVYFVPGMFLLCSNWSILSREHLLACQRQACFFDWSSNSQLTNQNVKQPCYHPSMTKTKANAPNFSILDQISHQNFAIYFIDANSPKISTVQLSRRCKPHILQTVDVSKTPSSLILFWGLLKSHQCS